MFLLFFIASVILLLFVIVRNSYNRLELGKQFDERIFETSELAIRIRAYHQRGAFLAAAGGYYEYEVRKKQSTIWRAMALFRLPLPEGIPEDQVAQLTEKTVFFFHGFVFGITTDGGDNWAVRGGEYPPLAAGILEQYAYIEAVDIRPNGTGSMSLSNFDPTTREKLPNVILNTSNFGRSWKKQAD